MRLHPKYGVNSTISICYYCGSEKNEIVLLGAAIDEEAPRTMIMNTEPCDQCKKYMEMGVILISVRDPYRIHECLECHHKWREIIEESPHTANLSGEKTPECPKCQKRTNVASGPAQEIGPSYHRTGGWAVVTENFIRRQIDNEEGVEELLTKRIGFVPNTAWNMMGLPKRSDMV
jgi:NAD-dependent SIR2 family protein deacetylase